MNSMITAAILEHARAEYPKESCGLIVLKKKDGVYIPCRNISEDPAMFVIHPEDYLAAEKQGQITTIVHSHPDANATPSEADRVACEASGLPWCIVGITNAAPPTWHTFVPTGYKAPLIGRSFVHGILDCYTLIQDWYFQEVGAHLPHFPRAVEWWKKGDNLYLDHFGDAGFVEAAGPLQRGDVILMQVLSDVPNHAAVYLGDDLMLHHLQNRLSAREPYGGYWKKHTAKVVRYAP